jgi:hypothetical protein
MVGAVALRVRLKAFLTPVHRLVAWCPIRPDLLALSLVTIVAALPRFALMFRLPVFYIVGSRPYYSAALEVFANLEPTALSPRHTPGYPAFLVGIMNSARY